MSIHNEPDRLIEEARAGDERALAELFNQYRPRLKRMVMLRMDARIQARCDASDVVQETYVELARRIADYAEDAKIPFFLWLRMLAGERLAKLHRKHLGAAMRDARREVSLVRKRTPEASSVFLASGLAGQFTSVDRNLIQEETQLKLQQALDSMAEDDREVLALRHFEEMSTEDTAIILGLTESGVLKRYTRALRRLRQFVNDNSNLDLT